MVGHETDLPRTHQVHSVKEHLPSLVFFQKNMQRKLPFCQTKASFPTCALLYPQSKYPASSSVQVAGTGSRTALGHLMPPPPGSCLVCCCAGHPRGLKRTKGKKAQWGSLHGSLQLCTAVKQRARLPFKKDVSKCNPESRLGITSCRPCLGRHMVSQAYQIQHCKTQLTHSPTCVREPGHRVTQKEAPKSIL